MGRGTRAFEAALDSGEAETAEACFGLAMALWWLGENHACVDRYGGAYALIRASGDVEGAARCAVWLAITYKSNFANFAAANGRSFDAVLCQMALMFFPDRIGALREMARVAAPSGTVAVLVPAGLGAQPPTVPAWTWPPAGGPEARSLLDTYFACGDLDELAGLFGRAGLRVTGTGTHGGTASFGSVGVVTQKWKEKTSGRG